MDLAGYLPTHGLSSLQALGAGVQISDSFTYAIKLGNGTLSWATARFNIVGTNDGPIITGSSGLGSVTEDASPTSAAGTINFSDIDVTDAHTVSATPAAGGYLGTFTPIVTDDSTGDGTGQVSWSFTVDNAALQFLAAGQILTQTYNVTINDGHGGTVSQAVTVTITGTNDGPTITVSGTDARGAVTEDAELGDAVGHGHDRLQRHRPDRRAHHERDGGRRQHAGRHADDGRGERKRDSPSLARSAGPTRSPTARRSIWPRARRRPRSSR